MRRQLCSLVVGASLALAVPTTAAQAATYRGTDPAGDVRSLDFDEETGGLSSAPAEAGTPPDATALVVTHARRSVTLRVVLDDLARPTGRRGVGVFFDIVGSNGQRRLASAFRQALPTEERRTEIVRASNERRVCPSAARSTFDYAGDTITMTFPRRCLGAPARFRVLGYALHAEDTRDSSPIGPTYDILTTTGGEFSPDSPARYTPWVKRG